MIWSPGRQTWFKGSEDICRCHMGLIPPTSPHANLWKIYYRVPCYFVWCQFIINICHHSLHLYWSLCKNDWWNFKHAHRARHCGTKGIFWVPTQLWRFVTQIISFQILGICFHSFEFDVIDGPELAHYKGYTSKVESLGDFSLWTSPSLTAVDCTMSSTADQS